MNQTQVSAAKDLHEGAVVLRRAIASSIINLSIAEVEDIESGIDDGTYSAIENLDIAEKKDATERAELLYREAVGDVLTLPRKIVSVLIDMARNRVNDIEAGLADGTYEATQNSDIGIKRAALEEAEFQNGKAVVERPDSNPDPEGAKVFFEELIASVETLGAVADKHGVNTLADLMYLQQAILKGERIEVWPGETEVGKLIQALPSADRWLKYTDLPAEWKKHCVRVESRSRTA